MLFIPWLYRVLEKRQVPEAQLRAEARDAEIGLADALKAGNESNGIIGRDAGPRLLRLPSSVYWAGLGAWGIRVFPGSRDSLFVTLRGRGRLLGASNGEDALAGAQTPAVWHPALPQMPRELLEHAVFRLTTDEAQFLIDRLVASQPAALLTMLARAGIDADCDYIWTHPHLSAFTPIARQLVRHGKIFSHVMHGAALLYNLSLSELRQRDDWVDGYRGLLEAWRDGLDLGAVRAWSLDEFWNVVEHPAHAVRPAAPEIVEKLKKTLLTERQAAAEMGWSVPKIRRLRLSGKLAYFPGRPPLIDKADLAQLKVGGAKAVTALVAAEAEAAVKKALADVRTERTGVEKAAQLARTKWLRLQPGKSR